MADLKDFLYELKSRVTIVDVISKRVKLTKKGHDYFGLCPFHHEKTGSFKVDPVKGLFYCFGCGAKGDMFRFVMQSESVDFMEAVERIAAYANLKIPQFKKEEQSDRKDVKEFLSFAKDQYKINLQKTKNQEIKDYLSYRGFRKDSIEKFELGFADIPDLYHHAKNNGFTDDILKKSGVFYNRSQDKFSGRLIFPIADITGKCIGFGGRTLANEHPKYLNSPETDVFKKSDNLYAYHLARKGKYKNLILVEGYVDVISMHEAGFDKTVACLGTTISERQIDLCWKLSDSPIVMLDGDQAGIKASYRWLSKILPKLEPGKTFRFAKLPDGGDPDSVLKQHGSGYMQEILNSSLTLQDWLWESSFLLHLSDTPENQALVLKNISDSIDTIQNQHIKALYKAWLKEQEISYLYSAKRKISSKRKKNQKTLSMTTVASKIEKYQEILLATIVNHPHIIESVIERFVAMDFHNSSYAWIKSALIKDYEENNNIDQTIEKLYNEYQVLFKYIELHAPFAKRVANNEEALNGWNETYSGYVLLLAEGREISSLQESLEKSFSYDDWERLKRVKRALLDRKKDTIL